MLYNAFYCITYYGNCSTLLIIRVQSYYNTSRNGNIILYNFDLSIILNIKQYT